MKMVLWNCYYGHNTTIRVKYKMKPFSFSWNIQDRWLVKDLGLCWKYLYGLFVSHNCVKFLLLNVSYFVYIRQGVFIIGQYILNIYWSIIYLEYVLIHAVADYFSKNLCYPKIEAPVGCNIQQLEIQWNTVYFNCVDQTAKCTWNL